MKYGVHALALGIDFPFDSESKYLIFYLDVCNEVMNG